MFVELRPRRSSEMSDDLVTIGLLLEALVSDEVNGDRHLETALCRELVELGVMHAEGETTFGLRPRHVLAPEVVTMIGELVPPLPLRYFIRPAK